MKTFASILGTIVLTILLPVTALVYRIDTYILHPEPLLRVADQNAIYTTLVPTLADTYITEDAVHSAGLDVLPREQAVTIVSETFQPEWIRSTLTQVITEFYRLRTPGTTFADLQLTVQMSDPKEHFLEALSNATLPIDENAFNPVLIAAVVPSQINIAHAFVPDYARNTTVKDSNDPMGFKQLAGDLTPDERSAIIEQTPEQLRMAQNIITRVHAVLPGALAVCAIIFTFIVVLNSTGKRHTLRWIAAATFFPGMVFLILAITDDFFIMPALDEKLSTIPSGLHTIARSVTSSYVAQFFDVFMIVGVALVGIALASVVIGLIEKHISAHKSTHHKHAPHENQSLQ